MNREIKIVVYALFMFTLLSGLVSCSESGKRTSSRSLTSSNGYVRVKNLKNNVILPVKIDVDHASLYSVNDTVWVGSSSYGNTISTMNHNEETMVSSIFFKGVLLNAK